MRSVSVSFSLHPRLDIPATRLTDNVYGGKPMALMSASTGMMGTARARYHLRQTFVILNAHPLNRPEVMAPFAQEKIDGNDKVTGQKTREKIRELLGSLVAWTRRLAGD